MTPLTNHFALEELTGSDYATRQGIDNRPDVDARVNLGVLAQGLESVRAVLAAPMHISSGYRCKELNSAIGGAPNSAHLKGLAADFTAPSLGDPEVIAAIIAANCDCIDFDQLILEGAWVHIAFANQVAPRNEVLTAHFYGGKPTYTQGLG